MSLAQPAQRPLVVSFQDSRLASFLATVFRRIAAWRAEREAIRRLSNFSDAMLKDMGVARSEIPDAVRYGRSAIAKHD